MCTTPVHCQTIQDLIPLDLSLAEEPMIDFTFPDERKEYFEDFLEDHDIQIPVKYLTPLIESGYIDKVVKCILKVDGTDFDDYSNCVQIPNTGENDEKRKQDEDIEVDNGKKKRKLDEHHSSSELKTD